jgi:hypothetical protein
MVACGLTRLLGRGILPFCRRHSLFTFTSDQVHQFYPPILWVSEILLVDHEILQEEFRRKKINCRRAKQAIVIAPSEYI